VHGGVGLGFGLTGFVCHRRMGARAIFGTAVPRVPFADDLRGDFPATNAERDSSG
jgi:hypothetical protein